MYTFKTVTLIILALILNIAGQAQLYTNFDDFKDACSNASPGDEIILAEGRYEAESITIADVNATENNPVIIRAENIGKDTLDDGTYFDLRHCSHIIIQGFIINITDKSTTFKIQTCNNIQITQNVFNGEGESTSKIGDEKSSSVWISIQSLWDDETGLSHHNKIDHNVFMNKHTLGNMIRIDGTNDLYVSQYDVIEYNYFKNMGPRAENEMEVIRIGWSAMSESDGYCRVENNLFEECNGDPEIISVKCNKNVVAHNTFRRCQGTLSLRHGNESIIDGNFFFGEGAEGTGGVRIYGSDHKVINNYFEGLTGTLWDAPITLTEGDAEEGDSGLSNHFRIERAIIANNTLINNTHGIEIGYDNNGKYSKPPRDVIMANNIILGNSNSLVKYINTPANMQWVNNIYTATGTAELGSGVTFTNAEMLAQDSKLSLNTELSYYKATNETPTYISTTNLVGEITNDIDGQQRSTTTNFGADEYSTAPVLYEPLSPADVGPSVGEYLYVSSSALSFPAAGSEIELTVSSNLNWTVENSADWIGIDPVSSSGYGAIVITIGENTTEIARTSTLEIKSTNAENGTITQQVSISQADSDPSVIELSVSELSFESATSVSSITVSSNTTWSVNVDADWITVNPKTGTNNVEITLSVAENNSVNARQAVVSITNNSDAEASILVTQLGHLGDAEKLVIVSAIASTEQNEEGKVNIAANVLDGNFETRWSGEGDGAFITLELEDFSRISFIKAGLYKGDERNSYFDILTSVDGENYTESIMGITTELTTEALVIFDTPDSSINFVKIVGHGNSTSDWNSFTEFEVWGWNLTNTIPFKNNAPILQTVVFPNPSKGSFSIKDLDFNKILIYDMNGKCVYKENNLGETKFYNPNLDAGMYLILLQNKGIINYSKLIIE